LYLLIKQQAKAWMSINVVYSIVCHVFFFDACELSGYEPSKMTARETSKAWRRGCVRRTRHLCVIAHGDTEAREKSKFSRAYRVFANGQVAAIAWGR
jgi:hypothetical protein